MAPEDWRAVRLSHRDVGPTGLPHPEEGFEYRRAEIRIDGVTVAQVGVRKKGFIGSVVSTRPSLKVKFDEYVRGQAFAGLGGLTLNNNNQDQTLLQQFLAYDLYRRAGVPAPQASFARVRVNGEDLGIYTRVETIDGAFLRRAFGSDAGVLYEGYAGDFTGPRTSQIVEKRGRRDLDRTAIPRLTALLAAPGALDVAAIEAIVDLDAFIRMWAIESLMGHWDSYSGNANNFYLYAHPDTKKLHFIPWGADDLFQDPGPLQFKMVPRSYKAEGVLARRLWEVPAIQERYRSAMRQILAGAWNEDRLLGELRTRATALQPQSHLRPDTVRAAATRIEAFIKGRRAAVEAELTGPAPVWPAGPPPSPPTPITLTGSFTAPWRTEVLANPMGVGSLSMTSDGGPPATAFVASGAYAVTYDQGGPLPASLREKYTGISLVGARKGGFVAVTLIVDPFLLAAGPGRLPVDSFAAWAIVVMQDGPGPPRVGIFGNTGELRLEEAAAREGGQIRGSFTVRGFLP
jgi:spore coat protein H